VINKSLKPSLVFDKFKTTNVHCVITGYQVFKPNATGIVLKPFPSREIQVPSDIQTVNFTIKAIADGGAELISSVKEVTTWKYIKEFPFFPDPLDDWTIELSSNKSKNTGVVQYQSIKATDL
jgi:hypothetical protein